MLWVLVLLNVLMKRFIFFRSLFVKVLNIIMLIIVYGFVMCFL